MNTLPTPTNLYYLLIFVFLASLTTLVLILTYSFYTWIVSRRKNVIYKQLYELDPRADAYNEALKIIEAARTKSLSLLKEAHLEKQSVEDSALRIEKELKALFETKARQMRKKQQKSLELITNDFLDQYKNLLESEKRQTSKSIVEATDIIRQKLLDEVKEFSNVLANQSYRSQAAIQKKINEEYESAKKEVDEYKKHAKERIESAVSGIIRRATLELIGKNMTQEDHEALITKSLDNILQSSEFSTV